MKELETEQGFPIFKAAFTGGVAIIMALMLLFGNPLFEIVSATNIAVFQSPTGKLWVETTPGIKWQGFAKVTTFPKSVQYWFTRSGDNGFENTQVEVRFNDGATGTFEGSLRIDMPLDAESMKDIYQIYGNMIAVENDLIRTVIEKSIYMSANLLTSKESYSDKKTDLIYWIEDQASKGVYQTTQKDVTKVDPVSGEKRTVKLVDIKLDENKNPLRQENSPVERFHIKLYNLALKNIGYDKKVVEQINQQQDAVMAVQTSIAEAKKAEQNAFTAAKNGEAEAAKSKWEQEKKNAQIVAEAEGRRKAAEQDKLAAEFKKQEQILLGEGEARRRQLVMEADGALDRKLEAWVEVQKAYANAIKDGKNPFVPSIIMGSGASGVPNSTQQLMDMIAVKTAKDLNLDMSAMKQK